MQNCILIFTAKILIIKRIRQNENIVHWKPVVYSDFNLFDLPIQSIIVSATNMHSPSSYCLLSFDQFTSKAIFQTECCNALLGFS